MPQISQEIIERIGQEVPRKRHHEMVWPLSNGIGGAGAPIELNSDAQDETNGPASTMDYWGEPRVIMPLTTITEYVWYFVGIYITLTDAGSQGKHFQGAFYKISNWNYASRNVGQAWDEGETVLTVDDAGPFTMNDLVWIVSDNHADGEIQKVADVTGDVVTVARETSQFGAPNTGLRWDHTFDNGASEKMYLCQRLTDPVWHPLYFQFENSTTRHTVRYAWAGYKTMQGYEGLIARVLNETDSGNDRSVLVKAIYNHP